MVIIMQNSQLVASRIEALADEHGLSIKQLLLDSRAGKNTVGKLKQGKDVYASTLARVAEQLGCSVDYLLGNTDVVNPESELRAILQINAEHPLNDRKLDVFHLICQIPDDKVDSMIAFISANL